MEELIQLLSKHKKTVATMESCTGGGVANAITNIPGASKVFMFGAITYSNAFKIKMGVSNGVIDKYSVYSSQVADEMSKHISLFANANYGIGITGKLNRKDQDNLCGEDDTIYISIYNHDCDQYLNRIIKATKTSREKNKNMIINNVVEMLLSLEKSI